MLLNAAVKRFVYIKKKKIVCIVAYLFIFILKGNKKVKQCFESICVIWVGQNQKT